MLKHSKQKYQMNYNQVNGPENLKLKKSKIVAEWMF